MDIKINQYQTPLVKTGLTLLLFIVITLLSTYQPLNAKSTLDKIAAIVDDDVVMLSDVHQLAVQLKNQKEYAGLTDKDLLKEALDQLILESLQIQKARQAGLRISDTALNITMEKLAQQNNLTLSQFQQALQRQGIDYSHFRDRIRQRLLINELRKRQLQRDTNITNQEINDLIANQSAQISKGIDFKYQQALIPAPPGTTLTDIRKAKARAEQLRTQILKGKDHRFQENTKQPSWKPANQIPPAVLRHLALLDKGELSEVFQDSKGFHILKLVDKRGFKKALITQIHARHILLKPDSGEDDNSVKHKLTEIRNQILAGADFAELARQYSQDTGSASSGGDLGWATPDSYVPAFAKVLVNTPENQISQPFKSKFGWHILQVLERKTLDKTEDMLRNQARGLLNKNKATDAYKSWLKQIRNDAFIEYRIKF